MKKELLTFVLSAAILSALLSGCNRSSVKTADTGVIPIHVVTSSTYEPFCYVDDQNNITGFEIDVMRAIDEAAPEISCTYEYASWDAMMPGIDSDRYDVVIYQLSKNEKREALYCMGKNPYYITNGDGVVTIPAHSAWKTLADIPATATIGVTIGGSYALTVEKYIKAHPDAFKVKYYDAEIDAIVEDIANGRVDATINDADVTKTKIKKAGLQDKVIVTGVMDPSTCTPSYCLFRKNEKGEQYAAIFDKYIEKLYYAGTLSKIAIKWFGNDNCISMMGSRGFYDGAPGSKK
jgi:ABC-type amino acid transport substrate-binding protein